MRCQTVVVDDPQDLCCTFDKYKYYKPSVRVSVESSIIIRRVKRDSHEKIAPGLCGQTPHQGCITDVNHGCFLYILTCVAHNSHRV